MRADATGWARPALLVVSLSVVAVCLGGTIASADQPTPTDVVVEVGLPPVPPTTIVVAVGEPPVPPTTVAVEVDLPPLPPLPDTFGDPTGEVGRPPVPPLPDTFGGDEADGDDTRAEVSSIAGAIAATADAAWRSA